MSAVRNPYARPVGEYVKETAAMNKHVHPVFADALAGFRRPEPMRPIAETGYTPGDDLAEFDETPPVDPPAFPISQKDG